MADTSQLLYLEPDDEITSVVRRLREADAGRVVLVASGRSKVTTSAVALRLLAGVATEDGREIALVADAAGRSLAAEAGIAAFASVAEASADGAVPATPDPTPLAPIHVVRGETEPPPPVADLEEAAPLSPPRIGPGDETQAVPVVDAPPPPRPVRTPRTQRPVAQRMRLPATRVTVAVLVVAVLLLGALLAAVAPAATIVIEPASVAIDPVGYTLALPPSGTREGELSAETTGSATGVHSDPTPATGQVTFSNYNTSTVRVAAGTQVAAGDVVFETTETVVVPTGFFAIPGTARAGVTAVEPGPAGNLAAGEIDVVLDAAVRNALRAFSDNPNRIVRNEEATSGGELNETPEITQEDVDTAIASIEASLSGQLRDLAGPDPELVYGPAQAGDPVVAIPGDLVGRRGEESFTLSGTVTYTRGYLERNAVQSAAAERLLADANAAPTGTQVLADTIAVDIGEVATEGDQLSVQVTLRAEAIPIVDVDAVRAAVAGLTGPQAADALSSLGTVSVELWPGWVSRVPDLSWRIDVQVTGGPVASGSPGPSGGASP